MDDREKLVRAKAQVQAMTGFYAHVAVFAVVLAGLFVINAAGSGVWWVQWVLLGWGAFVVAHGVSVFVGVPDVVRNWQARKTKELVDKM